MKLDSVLLELLLVSLLLYNLDGLDQVLCTTVCRLNESFINIKGWHFTVQLTDLSVTGRIEWTFFKDYEHTVQSHIETTVPQAVVRFAFYSVKFCGRQLHCFGNFERKYLSIKEPLDV